MKNLAVLALLSLTFAASAAPDAAAWTNARPNVKISVAAAGAETYKVSAVVTDLRNSRILSEPRLVTKAGMSAKAEIGAKGQPGATLVSFTVTVAPNGRTAAYSSEISANGQVIAAQQATLVVTR